MAGNIGHLRNDEKLYEDSGNMKKRVQNRKHLEVKWTGFRMGDWIGQDEEEGSCKEMPGSIIHVKCSVECLASSKH